VGEHEIWFAKPAMEWTEALPLGNGKLGAMLFGGGTLERLQLNDGTAWSGSPASEREEPRIDAADAAIALADARAAILVRDHLRATESLKRLQHRHSQTYLPIADVVIEQVANMTVVSTDYRRSLDLTTATHSVRTVVDDHPVRRSTFVSAGSRVLVHQFVSDAPDGVELRLSVSTLLREIGRESSKGRVAVALKMPSDVIPLHDEAAEPVVYSDDDALSLQGAVVVQWVHDGVDEAATGGESLRASGVRSATIFMTTETTFTTIASSPEGTAADALSTAHGSIDRAVALGAATIYARHCSDHDELYGRVELELGSTTASDVPTDERIRRGNADADGVLAVDPGLASLLFHYGRYLLISSSRAGGVPANLQGIWNPSLQPPWSSNYTTNINLQMNYWLAEIGNLAECLPPLFDLIDGLVYTGTETARRLYAAPGWVAHHNTDVWAYSQPVGGGMHDPKWAFWPFAGGWLVRHLWERLLHGGDDDFARNRAWGPIRSSAEFYLSWLVEQLDGTLGTSPSTSPENEFFTDDGQIASVARSSAFDLVVIADLFGMVIQLADRLHVEGDSVVEAAREALPRLARPTIGPDGTVKEWADYFEFPDPFHRHVAHLYFLYPGNGPMTTELAEAASLSLDQRGDESTGWSLAWKLAMRARLGEADKVSDLLRLVFRDMDLDRGPWVGGLYPNLFAAHPPFQIDGNFGFVSGLAECLVQSHGATIDLLSAVPRELVSGSVRGLIARPGIEIAIDWVPDEGGKPNLVVATLRAIVSSAVGEHRVRYGGRELLVMVGTDSTSTVRASDFKEILRSHADPDNGSVP
jgi:alpha-L-fucosidase 2